MSIFKGKNIVILVLAVLFLLATAGLIYSQITGQRFFEKNLSPEKAANSAIDYINQNLLRAGDKAELDGEVKLKEGLYNFKVKIGEQSLDSYLTKDGHLFFPQAISIVEKVKKVSSCQDIRKQKQPKLEAFVVSYCPFGAQMERILGEVIKNIPGLKNDIEIRYIGQIENGKIVSMHGDKEAKENLRQICLREEQPDKFYPYLACFLKEGKSSECLDSEKVDKEKLSQCEKDGSRGLAYAKKDFAAQEKYQVGGSPTLILNKEKVSEFDFGGRTAQAVKTLLCCGFEKAPNVCQKEISKDEAATGFSKTYSAGGSNSGSCN